MTNATYDLYLNSPFMGLIHAAECAIEEINGNPHRVGFRYTADYLGHAAAFPFDPIQLPLNSGETIFRYSGSLPGVLDDYLPDDWGKKVLTWLGGVLQTSPAAK